MPSLSLLRENKRVSRSPGANRIATVVDVYARKELCLKHLYRDPLLPNEGGMRRREGGSEEGLGGEER